jgi:hypothetical protein
MKIEERVAGLAAAYRDLALRGARNAEGMHEASKVLALTNKRLPDMVHAELDEAIASGELTKRFAAFAEGRENIIDAVVMVVREYIERVGDLYTDTTERMRLDAARSEGTAAAFATAAKALQHAVEVLDTPEAVAPVAAPVAAASEEPPTGD